MSLHYYKLLLLSTKGSSINGYNDYFKSRANLLCYLLKIAEVNGIQSMIFASKLCITPHSKKKKKKKTHIPPPPTLTHQQTKGVIY